MTVQYSIQKMVSNGTLSTIALGIQYLQRNDIHMRIAGEETPQSGARSGYTWSFIDNTTLKILPVVPNGVEVVVYRRTDIDAMYNIYSQNAQFDEATIDENNQQLLYIAQEYLEQGIPGAGVASVEFVRKVGLDVYYRLKLTDGSYTPEFIISKTIFEAIAGIDGAGYVGRATIPQIRAYTGNKVYILCSGVSSSNRTHSGAFFYDSTDTTSPDNGGSVLVDVTGRRWKRDYQKNSTGMFWEEYGAIIERVGDRLLIGDAVKNGANVQNQPDWLTQYQLATGRSFGFSQSGQMVVQNGVGSNEGGASNAIVAGAQTAKLNDGLNSIAILGVAVANKSTGTGNAYGGYFEGFRHSNAIGGAYGIEVDAINFKGAAETDPYRQSSYQTIGVQIAAGGKLPSTGQASCSAAINIQENGSTFDRGIVFGSTSLSGCDGLTGAAPALTMAKGHQLQWFSGAGTRTTTIESFTTTGAGGVIQRFVDHAVNLLNSASKPVHQVSWGPGTINFFSFRASGTGSPIQAVAAGDDTNVDIQLVPKGTGKIWLGQWTGQGDQAINGYIVVKDAAGNHRKIATLA